MTSSKLRLWRHRSYLHRTGLDHRAWLALGPEEVRAGQAFARSLRAVMDDGQAVNGPTQAGRQYAGQCH